MLSHHEQSALQSIAQQLEASDPALAEALRAGKVSGRPNMTTVWLVVLGFTGALFLAIGIVAASPSVAVCGIATLAGTAFAFGWRKRGKGDKGDKTRRAAIPPA